MLQHQNNILHLIDTFWLGGAQQVVKSIFENNQKCTTIFVLALRSTKQMIDIAHENVFIAKNTSKWNFCTPLKMTLNLIQKHQIKTLHCHLPKSQLIGILIKRFYYPKMKLIFQEQGDIIDPIPYNWIGYMFGAAQIDKVICCSSLVKEKLLNKTLLNKIKTTVIHNFNCFDLNDNFKKVKQENEFHIGFAGRITKRKGWADLITACQILSKKEPQIKIILHIAGVGPQLTKLKNISSKHTEGLTIKMYGFVKNMSDFYKMIDVLCVPSHWEPLGMVHLEAMSFGVPVIASDVPGMNEILIHNENALLFKPKNIEDLVLKLHNLMHDAHTKKTLSQNAYHTARALNYNHFETQLQEIYTHMHV